MKNNMDKPNKKTMLIGYAILIAGICMILIGTFAIKNLFLNFAGIVLLFFGAIIVSIGKFGFQKTVEISTTYEKAKAKEIAKGIKEGLRNDEE